MGGGGRGGGMGGPGMGGGNRQSPATVVKENLEKNDPIAFLLDRKKPLALSGTQKDSLKVLRKEMQHTQEPLFMEMDKLFAEARQQRGGRRIGAMLPDTARALMGQLTDIQDAYRDRARGQLSEGQRHVADSLMTSFLEEQRKKDENDRTRRRDRG